MPHGGLNLEILGGENARKRQLVWMGVVPEDVLRSVPHQLAAGGARVGYLEANVAMARAQQGVRRGVENPVWIGVTASGSTLSRSRIWVASPGTKASLSNCRIVAVCVVS